MFDNELKEFKKKVEDEMMSFFNLTPDGVSDEIQSMKIEYGKFLDLDNDTYRDVFVREYKDILMKYKTLVYFDGVYQRLLGIQKFSEEIA